MNNDKADIKLHFPADFLLGAASSAHQSEGNNRNSDWWHYEQQGRLPKSLDAADHYNRYEEDFTLAQDMGLNAMRISIEWARIEPVEGRWDATAIEHYKKVLKSLKQRGLKRVVTPWHWTLPLWLSEKGGFESKEGVEAFARYAWFLAQNLGTEVDLWVTLNEPEIYATLAYQQGSYPPFMKNLAQGWRVLQNLIAAHRAAYQALRQALGTVPIGIAKNAAYYEPYRKHHPLDQLLAFIIGRIDNHYFLEKIRKQLDFIGVNYYFYNRIKFDLRHLYVDMNHNFSYGQKTIDDQINRSDLGWVLFPEGIYHLLKSYQHYKLPIYVTENGLADAQDNRRGKFIRETLLWIRKALDEGVDVRGYLHWALTDNYEWTQGFAPRFGLIEIDYVTQKRLVRKSAEVLKEVSYDR